MPLTGFWIVSNAVDHFRIFGLITPKIRTFGLILLEFKNGRCILVVKVLLQMGDGHAWVFEVNACSLGSWGDFSDIII